jgi:hypothetical protein
MAIYLLDADVNGTQAVQHLIDAQLVLHKPIDSFPAYDRTCRELLPKVGPDDLVILDPISTLASTVRQDLKLGTDVQADIWEMRGQYFGDKQGMNQYQAAEHMIMRRLKNLLSRGCRVITTAHEDDQTDEISMQKLRAPKLNPAFYDALMANATDCFRLYEQLDDQLDDAGNVKIKAGTRILYLRKSEEMVAKYRVPRHVAEKLPRGIKDPTLPKLYAVLQKKPTWLVIYGGWGAGKTTLACSEAQEIWERSQNATPSKTKAHASQLTEKKEEQVA